jgi:hypothetical protein
MHLGITKTKLAAAGMLLLFSVPAAATTVDFSGVTPGTVVAGEAPGGAFVVGNTHFPDFAITATNNGSGPNSVLVFNSAAPTGGDPDLGAPNNLCGGPGIGAGGAPGMPGENCAAQGNLLIVAANITDTAPADGLVDQPNDEPNGGVMVFNFLSPVAIESAGFLDLDSDEHANITFYYQNNLAGTKYVGGLGDNSFQEVDLSLYGTIDRMEVEFASSGALTSLTYSRPTATENTSWGDVKQQFR